MTDVRTGWLGRAGGSDAPTMVLLHGHGGNNADLLALLPVMSSLLPGISVRVVSARGAFPVVRRPGGYSWFPEPADVQPPADVIAIQVDRLIRLIGEPAGPVVLFGYSQGMCAAILAMRRRPDLVRALVALSGFVFDTAQPGDAELSVRAQSGHGIPAFYGRDPADPAIPGFASAFALEFLAGHTALTERSYPGMGHGTSFAEVADVVAFLRTVL